MGRASRAKHGRRQARREAQLLAALLDAPGGYRDRYLRYQESGNRQDLLPREVHCQGSGKVHIGWRLRGELLPACHTQTGKLTETEADVTCQRCLQTSETERQLSRTMAVVGEQSLIQHFGKRAR